MDVEKDPLIRRAEVVLAETTQLREAHQRFRAQVEQQIQLMEQIEAELDPLLPHPYWELREVRALLAREAPSFPMRRAPA
ncbi:hypothetical protein [Microvirga yunnanensis]|uniref:hypothetical protein n=1 Tax=Microvirga yunnanensis TaxID=2953740 RepID=UPI0021CA6751|nr:MULTISPECIES: hypothetical protein [unclassified Microvirga]